jgi:predicted dehydrogenase
MPEADVVALYDSALDAARRLAPPHLSDGPGYDDLGVLLDRARPEAVLITLPDDETPGAVLRCPEVGAR